MLKVTKNIHVTKKASGKFISKNLDSSGFYLENPDRLPGSQFYSSVHINDSDLDELIEELTALREVLIESK